MKSKLWITGWLAIVLLIAAVLGYWVYKVDPFMHYHKPNTDAYYYTLDNERSQNDGIIKHFDYDALITGTSMTENFKTSEMDSLFGCTSIKVPYMGGTYKETNDCIKLALTSNPNLKTIVRCLDLEKIFDDKDAVRLDLGEYPTYLYDDNPFNDVEYLLNRDVIWDRAYQMTIDNDAEDFSPGITSFDDYARWQQGYLFGVNTVLPDGISTFAAGEPIHLSLEEKEAIKVNIQQNVTSLANEYPDVDFYYYLSPYSVAWWRSLVANGKVYRQIEAEQYAVELILQSDNIKLFSFSDRHDIIADLNNYKDYIHYGTWINSLVLKWMQEGQYQLSETNYRERLAKELDFYTTFDYLSLTGQVDYESDFYAAALCNEELTGAVPTAIPVDASSFELMNAELVKDQHNGKTGIKCTGSLQRRSEGEYSIADSLRDGSYVGGSTTIDLSTGHNYLVFYGKRLAYQGQPTVVLLDEQGNVEAEMFVGYYKIDEEWHQYSLDVSDLSGSVKIIFNGGYTDDTGDEGSAFVFSDIYLY